MSPAPAATRAHATPHRPAPFIFLLAILGLAGCTTIVNPDFAISDRTTQAEWDRMKAQPKGLDRPLLVLDGWRQPDFSSWALAQTLRTLTGADKSAVLSASYLTRADLNVIADDVIGRVEKKWPSADPGWTTEVDVVGFSMGGIVARTAAMQREASRAGKRLRIHRLYTLATPHRGAKLAMRIALDQAARDMRPGTDFLKRLDEALPDCGYELVCYAHTNDIIVGARNTAPPGREPIWTQGTLFFSHMTTRLDRRILADLALRLRDEPPLALKASEPPCD
jgi:pimeloyl-ACP methyl ester carboxylesterase